MTETPTEDLGALRVDIIKIARERLGLTQAQLAARVGATQGQISRWERNLLNVPVSRLAALEDALEMPRAALTPADCEAVLRAVLFRVEYEMDAPESLPRLISCAEQELTPGLRYLALRRGVTGLPPEGRPGPAAATPSRRPR